MNHHLLLVLFNLVTQVQFFYENNNRRKLGSFRSEICADSLPFPFLRFNQDEKEPVQLKY